MELIEAACLVAARSQETKPGIIWCALELVKAQDARKAYGEASKAIDRLVEAKYMRRASLGIYRLEVEGNEALNKQANVMRGVAEAALYGP